MPVVGGWGGCRAQPLMACLLLSRASCLTLQDATGGSPLTSLFLTSMSQRASARMEQASFTPQCAAACSGVQPS